MPAPDRELVDTLSKMIEYLNKSCDAMYSQMTVAEVTKILAQEIARINKTGTCDQQTIALLNAPTGDIQEIAIINGWSDPYFELSSIIDRYTEGCFKS